MQKKEKKKLIPILAICFVGAFGVYLGNGSKAAAENCNPKVPSTCVGGPTGPSSGVCGHNGNHCCKDAFGHSFCDLGNICGPDNVCAIPFNF